jgi:hypothetical protein
MLKHQLEALPMRRWLKRISLTFAVLLTVFIGAGWWAVQQTKMVPEFYTQATKTSPEETAAATLRLQADVKQLQQDAGQPGSWQAAFSDSEINAWLIQELPQKFPRLLSRGVSNPRIVIEDGQLLIAARYKDKRIDTVVSFEIHPELTEEPNMLAIRVKNLRAGALPLPLERFLKGITREAARGDVDVRWDITDSGPVALVTVPSEHPNFVVSPVVIESVRLREGQLQLAGHSGSIAQETYQPRGPVHRFVSYRHQANRKSHASRVSSLKKLDVQLR